MQVNQITYSRVFNLGNYETERIEYTALLEEGEEHSVALSNLREMVANTSSSEDSVCPAASLDGYVLFASTGDIRKAFDTADEWLREFDFGLRMTPDVKAFINHNHDYFTKVKEAAAAKESPRASERVAEVEHKLLEALKNG